ncbi:MAG: hypothetical protein NXH86_04205 [Flavobacteriaceae bacterium]|nr:hypothetical protein [Flavobacteriaceae bacterium]
MEVNQKKEERTEHIFLNVTPKVKKELEMAKYNHALKDSIIKNFIESESNWLKDEMRDIDEYTVKYRAKLLTIKDNFSEAQSSYVEQIEEIYSVANKTFSKIDKVSNTLNEKIESSYNQLEALSKKISYINHDRLDRLLDAVERYSNMTTEQKRLIEMIISEKQEA